METTYRMKEKETICLQSNSLYKLLLLSITLILNITILFIASEMFENHWLTKMAILSIFQLIINIYSLYKLGERLFSLSVLFLLFSFVFHFGNIVVYGLNLENKITSNFASLVSNNYFRDAVEFALFVQSFIAFGMLLVFFFNKKNMGISNLAKGDDEKYLSIIRTLGKILVLIGIGPTLYIDIGKLMLFFSSGYVSTYSLYQNGLLIILARLFKIGVFLLIIGNKNKRNIATTILVIMVSYQLLAMLSGNRGRAVVELLGLFYIYTNLVYKIKFKDILKYSVIAYIGVGLINALSKFRLTQSPDLEDLKVSLIDSFQTSPIISMLHEFGGTIITVWYSFLFFSGDEFIQYGTNYLLSLFTALPNVMGVLDPIHVKAVYVLKFPASYRSFLGGSYIGELYYSFKNLGIPFALIIGVFISFLSQKTYQTIVQKKYVLLSIFMIIFPDILWWIRGYFIEIVRYPIWISLIIYGIYTYLKWSSNHIKCDGFEGESKR